jgi:hypothetical protein
MVGGNLVVVCIYKYLMEEVEDVSLDKFIAEMIRYHWGQCHLRAIIEFYA